MPEWLNYYAVPTLSDMVAGMGTFREERNNDFRYSTSKMDNTAAQQTTELSAAMEQLLAEALDDFDEPHTVRSLSNQHASRTSIHEQQQTPMELDANRARRQPSQTPAKPDADRANGADGPGAAVPDTVELDATEPDAASAIVNQSLQTTRHISHNTFSLNEVAGLAAARADRLTSPTEKLTDLNEAAAAAAAAATETLPKSLCVGQLSDAAIAA